MSRILATLLLAAMVSLAGIAPVHAVDATISGTVIGPGGAPVTDGTMYATDGSVEEWVELDQAGAFNFTLPVGSYDVCTQISHALELLDECQDVTLGSGGAGGVAFQLAPMPRVTGIVTNDAGTPARTNVDFYPPGYGTRSSAPFSGMSDGQGRYDIGAPAGTYTVCAGAETNSKVDRRCTPDVVVPDEGASLPTVVLPRNSVITGTVTVAGNPFADLSSLHVDIFEFRAGQQLADEWHTTTVRADGTYAFAVPPNDYSIRFRGVRGSAISVEEFTWPTDGTRFTVTPGVHAGPNPVLTQSTGMMGTLTVQPTSTGPEDWEAGEYSILAYPEGATSLSSFGNSRTFNVPLEGVTTIAWHVTEEPGRYRIGFRRDKDGAVTFYGGGTLTTAPLVTVTDGATTQGLHGMWNTSLARYSFGRPTITGTVEAGQTLTAQPNADTWPVGTTFTYEWPDGATTRTHVVTDRDWQAHGPLIAVAVTGHTPGYAPVTRYSPIASGALPTTPSTPTPTPTTPPPTTPMTTPTTTTTPVPTPTVVPPAAPSADDVRAALEQALAAAKVRGKTRVGKTLSVRGLATSVQARAGVTYRFKWYAGTKAIKKATKAKLQLTRALKGKVISVKLTATSSSVSTSRKLKVGKVR